MNYEILLSGGLVITISDRCQSSILRLIQNVIFYFVEQR